VIFKHCATVAVVLGLASEAWAAELPCLDLRPSTTNVPSYGRYSDPAVCEGFYERDVAAAFVELLGLTTLDPLVEEEGRVVIRASSVPASVTALLHIQPLSVSTLYRVDASLAGGAATWSTDSLRRATQLSLGDLAFLATAGMSKQKALLVVPVGGAGLAGSPPGFRVTVRLSTFATSLVWRAYPTFSKAPRDLQWKEALDQPKYAWDQAVFEVIPPDKDNSLTLEIKAAGRDRTWFQPLRVIVVGRDYAAK